MRNKLLLVILITWSTLTVSLLSCNVVDNTIKGTIGSSPPSSPPSSSPNLALPTDPSLFSVTSTSSSQMGLSWITGANSTHGYRISYQTGASAPASCDAGIQISENDIIGTTHTVTGLTSGTQYSFRLCAINGKSPPDISTGVTVTGVTSPILLFQGFTGGTHLGTQLNGDNALEPITNSSVFALPDLQSNTWVDMMGNILLFHMNETNWQITTADQALDSSGNLLHAFNSWDPTNTFTEGLFGRGGHIPAVSSRKIGVYDTSAIDLANDLTLTAWLMPSDLDGSARDFVVRKGHNAPDISYGFTIETGDFPAFNVQMGATIYKAISSVALSNGSWAMWTGVRESTQLKFFLNGVLTGSTTIPSSLLTTNNDPLNIGDPGSGSGTNLEYYIDEFALFNEAKSATFISQIFERQELGRSLSLSQSLHTGVFTSPILDATATVSWQNIEWQSSHPYILPLPDNGGADAGFTYGTATMTNNQVLLHLEGSGSLADGANPIGDSSGNNHYGTVGNANSSGISYVPGVVGKGISFDGVDDYIELANPTGLTFDPNQNYTWSLWLKPRSFNSWNNIFTAAATASSFMAIYAHTYDNAGDSWSVEQGIALGITPSSGLSEGAKSFDKVLSLGRYHHISITYNKDLARGSRLKIYINGVDQTANGYSSGGSLTSIVPTSFRLGGSRDFSGDNLHGDMDEVVFDQRLLSDQEIADRYARASQQICFQVRSCADNTCSSESFGGPSGDPHQAYCDLRDISNNPSVSFVGLADSRYFQYRVFMGTNVISSAIDLLNVQVHAVEP